MRLIVNDLTRTITNKVWWMLMVVVAMSLLEVASLSGPNVCMVQQKYNITKRVKYRAPMAVRTYVWCFNMPPRCSKWSTEMRDLTRLETEERTAEMAVCCDGYKIKDISCVPICPQGKTGHGCSEDCPQNKWGPNCVHDCKPCHHGSCSPFTGECQCHPGWQGESCQTRLSTTLHPAVQILITPSSASTKPTSVGTTEDTSTSTIGTSTVTSLTTPVPSYNSESTAVTSTKRIEFTTPMPTHFKPVDLTNSVPAVYRNESMSIHLTTFRPDSKITNKNISVSAFYNRTDSYLKQTQATQSTVMSTIPISFEKESSKTTITVNETFMTTTMKPSTDITITTESLLETAHKEESTNMKVIKTTVKPTTVKFKPKEIWIRPAQKGESIVETKLKSNHDLQKQKVDTKKDFLQENTSPKTIIVSIIPTSITYVTYKKLALTTSASASQKSNVILKSYSKYAQELTKPITVQTSSTPFTIKLLNTTPRKENQQQLSSTFNSVLQNVTQLRSPPTTISTTKRTGSTVASKIMTNSMSSTFNVNNKRLDFYNQITTPLPVSNRSTQINTLLEISTHKSTTINISLTTEHPTTDKTFVTVAQENVTVKAATDKSKVTRTIRKAVDSNVTKTDKTDPITDDPTKHEEKFHILTEPEHITAVMGDKGNERSSIDLITVISIAGGIVMAVITVAVVIVMLERCRKPTYEDVRKYNDISMQVMINKNDVPPPPYVRSIFHTPLPEPPIEKCHYQPISTLDRNLKQFMRPVVVQTISPLMLENFRGILECHYDHLPRRSHDFGTMDSRGALAPSSEECVELLHPRAHSLTDSTIEAMKCEARQEVIDNTTSEPLYAEIPCWRPPSEHAVEVVNLNGEAVTEL